MKARPAETPRTFTETGGRIANIDHGSRAVDLDQFRKEHGTSHWKELAARAVTVGRDAHIDAKAEHQDVVAKLKATDVQTPSTRSLNPFKRRDLGSVYGGSTIHRAVMVAETAAAIGVALAIHASPLDNGMPFIGESDGSEQDGAAFLTEDQTSTTIAPSVELQLPAESDETTTTTTAEAPQEATFTDSTGRFACSGGVIEVQMLPEDQGSQFKAWERGAQGDAYDYRNIMGNGEDAMRVLTEAQQQFGADHYPTGCNNIS